MAARATTLAGSVKDELRLSCDDRGALMKKLLAPLGMLVLSACSQESVDDGSAQLSPAPYFDGDPANGAEFAVDVSVWETPLAQSQMDCFWDSGVRHVVVGTQEADITQQQLTMAIARGMTVDAYVYLYWNQDLATQVETAFAMVAGFPIGRMWLDIEQAPGTLGSKTLTTDIQTALTTCQAHGGVTCGIYTGPGFWKTYMGNESTFDATPLWYAFYNSKTSLSNWSTEAFGGWAKPAAKQFATKPLCGVGGADWDVMQVSATPTVVVDRNLPPDSGKAPSAPTSLYPVDGQVITYDYAKIMSSTIPRATAYQLAVEQWTGSAFIPYYTWTNTNAFVKFSPAVSNAIYRFRARAMNAHGWGDWSEFASFDFGKYTGPRPSTQPPPPNDNPPPQAGVPGDLSPADGSNLTTANVTLGCSPVTNATSYQFAIETQTSSGYAPYYTYTSSKDAVTFYPQTHGLEYRWRVRAMVGTYGDWSSYATFHFQ